jgi:hypothetical protein
MKTTSVKKVASIALLATTTASGLFTASNASAQLIPENLQVVTWQGGWQRGGSDPRQACLQYMYSQFPSANVQILDLDEEARWTGWHGRHREYRYGCTVVIRPLT